MVTTDTYTLRDGTVRTTDWYSVADTAKLLRAALRDAFPTGRFSVRSKVYSGGGSIDVRYTDGAPLDAVRAIADGYAGARFDGSIDLRTDVAAYVLDGKVVGSASIGTSGSGGYIPAHDDAVAGARRSHFGANYVFVERGFTDAAKARIATDLVAKYGPDVDWTDYSSWSRNALSVYANGIDLPFADPASRDYGDLATFVNRARDFDFLVG